MTLEPRDLAAEQLHVGLGPPDPLLQPRDLTLLGGEAALVLLELGEQRRLAGARRRRPFLLLPELLLRLLELALLRLQRILAPGLRGGEPGRQRERRQDEQRGRANVHGSRRARASQPPSPPRRVPAPSKVRMPTGVKKARSGMPSVRLTSGTRRGATSEYPIISAISTRTAPASPRIIPWSSKGSRIVDSGAPTS